MSYIKVEVEKQVVAELVNRHGQSRNVTYQAGERIGGAVEVSGAVDDQGDSVPGHIVLLDDESYIHFPEDSISYEN